ncbi:MAG: hypothetical protein H6538_05740 [Bacteroidales bacterium]|nr:hypothetical protein [Bacteroidales bacterium]MCB9000161.1 hypothetical protein [Bacteroidales bacterium]MCB9012714.1 hypothetical protein [Bacteroidales bacterium]
MKFKITSVLIIAGIFITSCTMQSEKSKLNSVSKVELKTIDGKSRLYVNGQEFFVKGGGLEFGDIESLASHGANAMRTWRVDNGQRSAKEILDEAQKNGLMVMMGLDLGRERQGFDYNDSLLVAQQFETIKTDVIALKDHPALLGWGIGNELNLRATNKKVWDAVQGVAAMIHEVDGNHPATTMLSGINKSDVDYIKENCPDLDFLCVQMYGDIVNLPQRLSDAGYKGPYLVTEWGATGHWEVAKTSWDAPIEQTSTEKAAAIAERYEKAILADTNNCMGSFVFLWGQKQERTPTWYGLFTENNEETEAVDQMHYFWKGTWPVNRCPTIISASMNGKTRFDNITLIPGNEYVSVIQALDPDNDSLYVRTEILHESTDLKDGGDFETRPEALNELVKEASSSRVVFNAPEKKGPYRLFIYILDGKNHAATVNFPFMVR